ncbi:hypothetical protein NX722_00840 [Endozoicomonas gorgoniicola]|uniref:Uncharacterized protein n=1 Tax=Endozoicomonas gorgoniicola TaxID=1234144 RepID=A0ABT3MPC3_9GAMM|nr:hypothetical protein [Endozoicomonas gorgoniicola]MCW7551225.1 hypothetical protein [Endozoicomonas gorgoniicola]
MPHGKKELQPKALTQDVNELKMAMLNDIASIISSDSELNANVKTSIDRQAISPLRKTSEIQISGADTVSRPVAVSFQKAFEQSLVNMINESKITQVTAIIHTRQPTTPLCNSPGKVLAKTLPPSMMSDTARRKTIEDRTITLRRMAKQPEIDLYVAYIHNGLNKRSLEEQAIYRSEVSNPENTSLHDSEMACDEMPGDIVGASYVITTRQGHRLYFGNNGVQAIDGTGNTLWRYWFGGLDNATVNTRYKEVMDYLRKCGLNLKL